MLLATLVVGCEQRPPGRPFEFDVMPGMPSTCAGIGSLTRPGGVCSAVALGGATVLTAAHCIRNEQPARLRFRMPGGTEMAVSRGVWHPRYVAAGTRYDVAVLDVPGLDAPEMSRAALPLDVSVVVVGYGLPNPGQQTSGSMSSGATPGAIRTLFRDEGDSVACYGDSGGGVLVPDPGRRSGEGACGSLAGILVDADLRCVAWSVAIELTAISAWIRCATSQLQTEPSGFRASSCERPCVARNAGGLGCASR